jgi:uncharacterized protein YraI
MKKILCSIGALLLGAPLLASAADAWVVADISLQAGPDTDFPSLAMLEAGTPVRVEGCIDGWTWCDVVAFEDRGWVPGTFLQERVGGQPVVIIDAGARIGIPIVSFSIGTYWDRHYHNRPFYSQRSRFASFRFSEHHHSPPRPTQIVATAPRPSARPRPMTGTAAQQSTTVSGSAAISGTATARDRNRTDNRASTTGTATTGTATTTQRADTTQQRATAQRETTQQRETAQRDMAQRERERQDRSTTQSTRSDQPMRDEQRQNEQRRAAQTQPRQTPPDVAPRPEERPQSQPQDRPNRQVAREEHGNQPQRDQGARQQQPKPKDELKQPPKRSKDSNKDTDTDDNGGGR